MNLSNSIEISEIWKDIFGFNGLYQISNTGKVKSFYSSIFHPKPLGGLIMKPVGKLKTYLRINLQTESGPEQFLIHRLVATAFIPNPDNLSEVNHKDGDKSNNNDWNLEWSTRKDNLDHSFENNLVGHSKKRIMQSGEDGKLVEVFESVMDAHRATKVCMQSISACANNHKHRKTAGGYIWQFENTII